MFYLSSFLIMTGVVVAGSSIIDQCRISNQYLLLQFTTSNNQMMLEGFTGTGMKCCEHSYNMYVVCVLNENCSAYYYKRKRLDDLVLKIGGVTINSSACHSVEMTHPPVYVIDHDQEDNLLLNFQHQDDVHTINNTIIHDNNNKTTPHQCFECVHPELQRHGIFVLTFYLIGLFTLTVIVGTLPIKMKY